MRAVVIADDDSLVGNLACEPPDLLISLGDLWDSTIEKARNEYRCDRVLAVRGNHDSAAPFPEGITDMHLTACTVDGIVFGGFEGSWKYKPRGHHMFEQEDVSRALEAFPPVDVFLAHNSPQGYHERDSEVHQGFAAFTDYIDHAKPQIFIHGHQHISQTSRRDGTMIIGVFGEAEIALETRREQASDGKPDNVAS